MLSPRQSHHQKGGHGGHTQKSMEPKTAKLWPTVCWKKREHKAWLLGLTLTLVYRENEDKRTQCVHAEQGFHTCWDITLGEFVNTFQVPSTPPDQTLQSNAYGAGAYQGHTDQCGHP